MRNRYAVSHRHYQRWLGGGGYQLYRSHRSCIHQNQPSHLLLASIPSLLIDLIDLLIDLIDHPLRVAILAQTHADKGFKRGDFRTLVAHSYLFSNVMTDLLGRRVVANPVAALMVPRCS